jgi:hypothetical protein
MTIINRSKIVKMSNDKQCSEMDTLKELRVSNPHIIVIEDTDKPRYSLQCIQVIREELGFDYITINYRC